MRAAKVLHSAMSICVQIGFILGQSVSSSPWSLFSHVHIAWFYLQVLLRHANRWFDLESFAFSRKISISPDGLSGFSANIVPPPYGQENVWQETQCSTLCFNTVMFDYLFMLINSCYYGSREWKCSEINTLKIVILRWLSVS